MSDKVPCVIHHIVLENDNGTEIPSVMATCSRCQHTTESYGTSDASIKRCLALMREECPLNESNYYDED